MRATNRPGLRPEAWVQCERCQRWRRLPAALAAALDADDPWHCEDNPDGRFNSCQVKQELSDAEIDRLVQQRSIKASARQPSGSRGSDETSDSNSTDDDDDDDAGADGGSAPSGRFPGWDQLPHIWQQISSNSYLTSGATKRHAEKDPDPCQCPAKGQGSGCGARCINRASNIECVQELCPCKRRCTNQAFTRRQYARLEVRHVGAKGHGLFATEPIHEGQFVIEYVGEVLSEGEFKRRRKFLMRMGRRHVYFMDLGEGLVLDASRKGSLARFVNHSCSPNCEMPEWLVRGRPVRGLFALCDIPAGVELTIDYNLQPYGSKSTPPEGFHFSGQMDSHSLLQPMRCLCGSVNCRGTIGGSSADMDLDGGQDADADDGQDGQDEEEHQVIMIPESHQDAVTAAILDRVVGLSWKKGWTSQMTERLQSLTRQQGAAPVAAPAKQRQGAAPVAAPAKQRQGRGPSSGATGGQHRPGAGSRSSSLEPGGNGGSRAAVQRRRASPPKRLRLRPPSGAAAPAAAAADAARTATGGKPTAGAAPVAVAVTAAGGPAASLRRCEARGPTQRRTAGASGTPAAVGAGAGAAAGTARVAGGAGASALGPIQQKQQVQVSNSGIEPDPPHPPAPAPAPAPAVSTSGLEPGTPSTPLPLNPKDHRELRQELRQWQQELRQQRALQPPPQQQQEQELRQQQELQWQWQQQQQALQRPAQQALQRPAQQAIQPPPPPQRQQAMQQPAQQQQQLAPSLQQAAAVEQRWQQQAAGEQRWQQQAASQRLPQPQAPLQQQQAVEQRSQHLHQPQQQPPQQQLQQQQQPPPQQQQPPPQQPLLQPPQQQPKQQPCPTAMVVRKRLQVTPIDAVVVEAYMRQWCAWSAAMQAREWANMREYLRADDWENLEVHLCSAVDS